MKVISIIVPCYNESSAIPIFFRETETVRNNNFPFVDFEYIFVDDGSNDDTVSEIKKLSKEGIGVRFISFSRNFGKEAAMLAGLERATGDYIAIMDVDLQDPPSLLPVMYDALAKEGYDQAATRRADRKGEPFLRSLFSKMFYGIMKRISNVDVVSGARDFRLMKRCVADAVLSLPEKSRYSKGIFNYVGYKTKWISYDNIERSAGETKWSFKELFKYAVLGFTSFSSVPLYLSLFVGIVFCAVAFGLMFPFLITSEITYLMISLLLFTSGMILVSVGVTGRYVAHIFEESKKRPLYIVRATEKDFKNEKRESDI